jgi:hypothetical protein
MKKIQLLRVGGGFDRALARNFISYGAHLGGNLVLEAVTIPVNLAARRQSILKSHQVGAFQVRSCFKPQLVSS